jgi:hypothetical protein
MISIAIWAIFRPICHSAEAPHANDENGYFLCYLKNVAGNVILPPHHNWIPAFAGMVFNWILAYFLSNFPFQLAIDATKNENGAQNILIVF